MMWYFLCVYEAKHCEVGATSGLPRLQCFLWCEITAATREAGKGHYKSSCDYYTTCSNGSIQVSQSIKLVTTALHNTRFIVWLHFRNCQQPFITFTFREIGRKHPLLTEADTRKLLLHNSTRSKKTPFIFAVDVVMYIFLYYYFRRSYIESYRQSRMWTLFEWILHEHFAEISSSRCSNYLALRIRIHVYILSKTARLYASQRVTLDPPISHHDTKPSVINKDTASFLKQYIVYCFVLSRYNVFPRAGINAPSKLPITHITPHLYWNDQVFFISYSFILIRDASFIGVCPITWFSMRPWHALHPPAIMNNSLGILSGGLLMRCFDCFSSVFTNGYSSFFHQNVSSELSVRIEQESWQNHVSILMFCASVFPAVHSCVLHS